ncbi:MAG: hypothetical protein WDA65_06325 [Christensenellales bacterium]
MRIEKRHLERLSGCYAVSVLKDGGSQKLLFASEEREPCHIYDADTFLRQTVWDGPGGTMAMVQIPDADGSFLAIQNFFPIFQGKDAAIVRADRRNGMWEVKTLLKLPYVHRFDLIPSNGRNYFLGAALCTDKRYTDDWSYPGRVCVGILPEDPNGRIEIKTLLDGLTKNHGCCPGMWKGRRTTFITSDEGAFAITPPEEFGGAWEVEKIIDRPISDIALCDIDGDGQDEIATIEPFHGGNFLINKFINGNWEIVYRYDKRAELLHAIWGGKLRNTAAFIGGCRGFGNKLFMIHYKDGVFKAAIIDKDIGFSNVAVAHGKDKDIILTANTERGYGTVYIVTD